MTSKEKYVYKNTLLIKRASKLILIYPIDGIQISLIKVGKIQYFTV